MKLNTPEKQYSKITTINHRKKFAQFFTPLPIAKLMSKWLFGNKNLNSVLEPAFGLGIFSRVLLESKKDINIKAFEIDKKIFDESNKIFSEHKNINLTLEDYMYNDWSNKYDGIICNPPYLKFHDYDNKNILNEIKEKLSLSLNGFSNLYTLFLLKSIHQLNKEGRSAYIVPSEFLNSDYGKLVKANLIKNRALRHIIVINFEENIFDDAITTASILLFANDNKTKNVEFHNIQNLDDLKNIEKIIDFYPKSKKEANSISLNCLDPNIKWRKYYQKQNSDNFKNLVPFLNYGKAMRGIATGANDYFTFNISRARKFNISDKYLLPCICKSIDVKTDFFTGLDLEEMQKKDKLSFLINANFDEKDKNISEYLSFGEKQGVNKKYLTANRDPWYSLENRQPAPILVSVFNRNGLRFIKNEARISNLTTFHCIYLNMFSMQKEDLLFAYLLTDVAKQIFEDNRREYGNGLKKFEPNDINKAMMLDLDKLSKNDESKIMQNYNKYRKTVINKKPDDKIVNEINQIFINAYSI